MATDAKQITHTLVGSSEESRGLSMLEFRILAVLESRSDSCEYGLEIHKTIARCATGKESVPPLGGTYNALYRMTNEGLVDFKWSDTGPAARRKYYHLTDKGKRTFEVSKAVLFRLMTPDAETRDQRESYES